MRNVATASVPLLIALVGGTTLGGGDVERMRIQVARPAVTHADATPALTEEMERWLEEQNPFGMPQTEMPGNRTLVVREGYSLNHNNVDLIADWVSFRLTKEYADGAESRPSSSAFKPDPKLPAGRRAEKSDYKGWQNVYDRGHQCASGDSKGRGTRVIRESFFLSNMTPQASRLNQQKWRILEGRIQNSARDRDELWVITGPVFLDEDSDGIVQHYVLGKNLVAVPTHYYKIVYAVTDSEGAAEGEEDGDGAGTAVEAMAFLVPNEVIGEEFEDYLVSIDEIEELTGYDFLSKIEDTQEGVLEAEPADEVWG